jgi:prolyl oligopeptidase
VLAAVALFSSPSHGQSAPPATARRIVVDTAYGQVVADPYRWLEDSHGPEATQWLKSQDAYTRTTLATIPGRAKFLARVKALDLGSTEVRGTQVWGGRTFYLKVPAGSDNARLYVRDRLDAPERLLVDPDRLTTRDVHYAIDYYTPSTDGALVAYGISAGGSEHSVIHIIETSTGTLLPDSIDRANFGLISWLPGNRSFLYNRLQKLTPDMPKTAFEQRSRAYIHQLGQDPETDIFVFGYGYAPALTIADNDISGVTYSSASAFLIGVVAHGTQNELTAYVAPLDQARSSPIPWKKLFDVNDAIVSFDVRGDDLYARSHRQQAHYEVLKTSLTHPDVAHAKTVVPASDVVIQEADVARDGIYIRDLDAGIGRLRRLSFDGTIESIPVGQGKSVSDIAVASTEDGVRVHAVSWTTAPVWLTYDAHRGTVRDMGIVPPFPIPTSDYEALEVRAKSADGTMVPLSIVRRKGLALDGRHPTHLVGYGAYGISIDPQFDPTRLAWLERGGTLAIAHVRGGGELGEEWYRAGYKLTKQHTIDDFLACAQYLIDNKYTSPAQLSGEGTSAGGVLIGGAITQRPDLFAGALIRVGLSDALRAEFTPNGPPNIAEFGTVKDSDGFRGLYAMDAYQHVKDGTPYPGVLLTAGYNDPRVDPSQSGKMAARLQAATSSKRPVLLRVDFDAGHGFGSTRAQHDLEYADEMAFLLWQDGDPAFQPSSTRAGVQ